jgi:hypothetical protein
MNNFDNEYQSDFDYSGEWIDKDDLMSVMDEETIKDNYDSETMTLIKEFR